MVLWDGGFSGDYSGSPKGFSSSETTTTGPVLSLILRNGIYELDCHSPPESAPVARGKDLGDVLSRGRVDGAAAKVIMDLASRLKEGDVVHIKNTVEFLVK
ncbi:MAG: hypothetical protein AABX75_00090 [Nanoarchaeota archaeon]